MRQDENEDEHEDKRFRFFLGTAIDEQTMLLILHSMYCFFHVVNFIRFHALFDPALKTFGFFYLKSSFRNKPDPQTMAEIKKRERNGKLSCSQSLYAVKSCHLAKSETIPLP